MTYSGIICTLEHVRAHPDADRIKLATAAGSQVVIGLNHQDGELGIYFDTDGQLSDEYCQANDLYPRMEDGKKAGGFIDQKNRRIRSQKFRGEKSEGLWMPISSLAFTGDISTLKVGDRIESLNGVLICNKYFTPQTLRAMSKVKAVKTTKCPHFKKHVDTEKWKHFKGTLRVGDMLYFTEKLHGTSGRYANTLVRRDPPKGLWNKLKEWVRPQPEFEYRHMVGSRNVIITEETGPGFYDGHDFRHAVLEKNGIVGKLNEGETLYFEIVGYDHNGKTIMASQNIKSYKKDFPEIYEKYGDTISYTYGQPLGTCQMYVYAITHDLSDGTHMQLSWPQVKRRCRELGINHVPERNIGLATIYTAKHVIDQLDQQAIPKALDSLSFEQSCFEGQFAEGICIRVERVDGTIEFVKLKNFSFGVFEGFQRLDDNFVDMEESS